MASELKKLRELLAANRDERLRLRKNVDKINRLIAKSRALGKETPATPQPVADPGVELLQTVYSTLTTLFKEIQPKNDSAGKCLSRLLIRSEGCAARAMSMAEHPSHFEGLRFEFILFRKAQGEDAAQRDRFASIEELIDLIKATLDGRSRAVI